MAFAVTERARTLGDARIGTAPMDVEDDASPSSSSSPDMDELTRDIVLAAYRGDVERVTSVLQHCGPSAVAVMSLTRAAAVELLGENVYLGSHSWSTQEGFPLMYFAGECRGSRVPRAARGSTWRRGQGTRSRD